MVLYTLGQFCSQLCYVGGLAADNREERLGFFIIQFLIWAVSAVFFLVAVFQMRKSLVNYYNVVEPIGLRLSGSMTFFFHILYLQYHFSRIADWKQTGYLRPQ